MQFLDHKSIIDLLRQEARNTLTFQTIDSSVLSFSTQLPFYLNTPQIKTFSSIESQISDLEQLKKSFLE